jgi:hypothetical protein
LRGGGKGQREQIARDILKYLLHHPAAADTFEGIARWRILEEVTRRSIASTEGAMEWLIAEGFLCEEKIAGGRTIFRLAAGKKKEAELLVKEKEPKKPGSFRRAAKS